MVRKLAATSSTETVEPTASKAAPAKATPSTVAKKKVAKPAALPAKKAVSVGSEPIAQGVTNMTDTVKATAEKATEFFADVVEAGKIVAKGAQEMGKTNIEVAKKNFEDVQVAVKELTAVKSPTDFVKLQGELARKGFDTAVAQGSKNTEAMVKLVNEMFQPISNRIAVTTELFKKAA
jgi:phasin family protein